VNKPAAIQTAIARSGAIDSPGRFHILYRVGYITGKLYYANGTVGQASWTPTLIDRSGNTGIYPTITVSGNTIHAAYFSKSSKTLMYATATVGGAWTKSTVVSDIGVNGGHCVIAVKAGVPVIAYYDSNSTAVRYASTSGGTYPSYTWTSENVYALNDSGRHNSIAIDLTGKVHISFYDYSNRRLLYAKGE